MTQVLSATLGAIGEGVAIEGMETVLSWALLNPHPQRLQLQRSLVMDEAACEQTSPPSLGVCNHRQRALAGETVREVVGQVK